MSDIKTKPIKEWLNELPNMNLSTSTKMVGMDDGQTGKLNAPLFYRVSWNTPDTLLSELTSLYNLVSPGGRYILIELYGYNSALLLFFSSGNNVRGTNLYTGKKFEALNIDPNTLTITKLLSDYVVEDTTSVGDVYGLKNYSISFTDGADSHYMYEVKDLIEDEGGDITKLNYVCLQGNQLLMQFAWVGGNNYYVYALDILTLKSYNYGIDITTTTIADFLAMKSVADIPPAYTHPETHPASMITGLSKVATSGSYNDLTDKPDIPSGGGSGSGGSIIDVAELPTENIDTTAMYRVNKIDKVNMVVVEKDSDGAIVNKHIDFFEGMSCDIEVVDTLPTVGKVGVDFNTAKAYLYYNSADGLIYIYVTEELSSTMERPVGWSLLFPPEILTPIDSLEEAVNPLLIHLLITKKPQLYHYCNNEWIKIYTSTYDIPAKLVDHETRITELESNSNSGGTSSGGSASIIYATELPSTPQQAIYVITEDEVVKVDFYQSQTLPPEIAYCEIVDALPEIGIPAMDLSANAMYVYYLTTDGEIYGYVDAALEAAGGVPVGWYPVAPLFDAVGTTYGGQITSTDQATDASTLYTLLTKQPKTRVYVPMPDGTFLELTSGVRTRFNEKSGTVSITEM